MPRNGTERGRKGIPGEFACCNIGVSIWWCFHYYGRSGKYNFFFNRAKKLEKTKHTHTLLSLVAATAASCCRRRPTPPHCLTSPKRSCARRGQAYAKMFGSYAALEVGHVHHALTAFTGAQSEEIFLAGAGRGVGKKSLWKKITKSVGIIPATYE